MIYGNKVVCMLSWCYGMQDDYTSETISSHIVYLTSVMYPSFIMNNYIFLMIIKIVDLFFGYFLGNKSQYFY